MTTLMQCLSTRVIPIVAAATVILIMGAAPAVVLGQATSNGGATREESLRADREQRVSEFWADPVTITIRNRGGSLDVAGVERPTQLPTGEKSKSRQRKQAKWA
jgi:hypothetical protein